MLLRLLGRARRALVAVTVRMAERQLRKLPGGEVVRASRLPEFLRGFISLVAVVVGLDLVYTWLTFVLNRFPYSRPWGEALRGFLLEQISQIGLGILEAIPGLFTVLLILFVARFAARLAGQLFDAVERGRLDLPGVHRDTAQTTRRLFTVLLWMFASVAAYPYLPGADTDAFKGLSVFVGLMLSLGVERDCEPGDERADDHLLTCRAARRFRAYRRCRRHRDRRGHALDQGEDAAP